MTEVAINMIKNIIRISAKGNRANKNVLKREFEGANAFISVSSIKQSNEKNASFPVPTYLENENAFEKLFGTEIPNDSHREISWI
jgi:hypothetical protein